MPIAAMTDLVAAARAGRYAIGSFTVLTVEHAEAVVSGAARAQRPVVLQIGESCVSYHGSLRPLALATLAVAGTAEVPVVVALDHARSEGLVREAIELGFGSVVFDGTRLARAENVRRARQVVEICHAAGSWVEAELGETDGAGDAHAPGAQTDPAAAKEFAEQTGVDLLAVAVSSRHHMRTHDAALDLARADALASAVPVPLALHLAHAVPDAELGAVAGVGVVRVDVSSHLNRPFTSAVRAHLAHAPESTDPRAYLSLARAAVTDEVARVLGTLQG